MAIFQPQDSENTKAPSNFPLPIGVRLSKYCTGDHGCIGEPLHNPTILQSGATIYQTQVLKPTGAQRNE